MIIGAMLISCLTPIQIGFFYPISKRAQPDWVARAAIDSVRLIGIGENRGKPILEIVNPEFNLRDRTKDDTPVSKRKKFIQDYLKNSVNVDIK
jgi:hypothetical protein